MDSTNNKTTLEIMGMACANSLLENGIEWLNTLGENDFLNGGKLSQQASSFLVIGHAIIQQQERLAVVKNEHLEALKDGIDSLNNNLENVKDSINDLGFYFGTLDENLIWLRGIKEQLEYVVESIDCAGAKAPLADDVKLTALNSYHALAALKERWLRQHQQHTEAEYIAAINEFEILVGL